MNDKSQMEKQIFHAAQIWKHIIVSPNREVVDHRFVSKATCEPDQCAKPTGEVQEEAGGNVPLVCGKTPTEHRMVTLKAYIDTDQNLYYNPPMTNRETFKSLYEQNLRNFIKEMFAEQRDKAWPENSRETQIARFVSQFDNGYFSHDQPSVVKTCLQLNIKNTKKAILNFLAEGEKVA